MFHIKSPSAARRASPASFNAGGNYMQCLLPNSRSPLTFTSHRVLYLTLTLCHTRSPSTLGTPVHLLIHAATQSANHVEAVHCIKIMRLQVRSPGYCSNQEGQQLRGWRQNRQTGRETTVTQITTVHSCEWTRRWATGGATVVTGGGGCSLGPLIPVHCVLYTNQGGRTSAI